LQGGKINNGAWTREALSAETQSARPHEAPGAQKAD
jgi:hypothetical protein